jgi:hypothetical protein
MVLLAQIDRFPHGRGAAVRAASDGDGDDMAPAPTRRACSRAIADEPSGAVSVVGDFNDWDPFAHPLRRRANGTRSAAVTVAAGARLRFRFLAEGGIWFNDETAGEWDGQDASIAV